MNGCYRFCGAAIKGKNDALELLLKRAEALASDEKL